MGSNWEEFGININGKKLSHLRFADDLTLIEEDPEKLNQMLSQLDKEGSKVGLKINVGKTKLMTNDIPDYIFKIGDEPVEYVQEFTYLGQLISFHERQDKEIAKRIQNAWKQFWRLKNYLVPRKSQWS